MSSVSADGYILEYDIENKKIKVYFDDRYIDTFGEVEFKWKSGLFRQGSKYP